MVHYSHAHVAAGTPPVCPHCTSSRTQVIGRSTDARTLIVRCTTCGERTTVAVGTERSAHNRETLEAT
jgi:transposase-like protein